MASEVAEIKKALGAMDQRGSEDRLRGCGAAGNGTVSLSALSQAS